MSRSAPARAYLLAYNAAQLAGWGWALIQTLAALRGDAAHAAPAHRSLWGSKAAAAASSVYAAAAPAVRACQACALLETVHVVLGKRMGRERGERRRAHPLFILSSILLSIPQASSQARPPWPSCSGLAGPTSCF